MRLIFSRGPRSAANAIAILAVLALAPSCRHDGDPPREALDRLARAAADRDASAFLDQVATDFQAADGSKRSDVEQTIRRLFAGYEKLDVTLDDVAIERSESAALARFRARLSGKARAIGGLEGFLPRESAYRFEVRLVPSDGRWRVAWASWREAE
jgi:hypothetical protein